MAKVTFNPAIEGITKSIGGLTFSKWKRQNILRCKPDVKNPKTRKQQQVNDRFKLVAKTWNNINKDKNKIILKSWNLLAGRGEKDVTGYDIFVERNMEHFKNNEPLEISTFFDTALPENEEQDTEGLIVKNFQAGAESGNGRIRCSFDALPRGRQLSIFTQEIIDGAATEKITRHDFGEAASPVTIENLNPGMEYFVYAIITRGEFTKATGISDTVALRVTLPGAVTQ